jgi:hypothetical protein
MRQQNNGRRRQNRGTNRRSYSNGNNYGNINKNTVIDSSGPDGRQRGSVSLLNEKYISLASDAAASDDRILAESYLQFADHYYRLQKEIEINNEAREAKLSQEKNSNENNHVEQEVQSDEQNLTARPSRRKRAFQIKENQVLAQEGKNQTKILNDSPEQVSKDNNIQPSKKLSEAVKVKSVEGKKNADESGLLI